MTHTNIPFVHLKARTEHSVQDGIVRIKDYVKQAVAFNKVQLQWQMS